MGNPSGASIVSITSGAGCNSKLERQTPVRLRPTERSALAIGLIAWLCLLKRRQFGTCLRNTHYGREGRDIAIKTAGIEQLRHQAKIGQRRLIAMAVAAGSGMIGQHGLNAGQPHGYPMPV